MSSTSLNRRTFLSSTALVAVSLSTSATKASTPTAPDTDFKFEITRSEEEWRAMLSDEEYRIMREGGTEQRFTSDLWDEERAGTYACRGCGLDLYESKWKTILPIGWVFYYHAIPATVMLGIDQLPPEMSGSNDDMATAEAMVEAHCRRCGSHLGHVVSIKGKVLHCINGTSLEFTPSAA